MPTESLLEQVHIFKDNHKILNILIYVISEIRKEGRKIEDIVLSKLKNEYLIDLQKIAPSAFRPTILLRHVFSQHTFDEGIAATLVKLIKRQEKNLLVVYELVSCDLDIDFSCCAEDVLVSAMSNYYLSEHHKHHCSEIAFRILRNTRENSGALVKIIQFYIEKIKSVNEEGAKLVYLNLLSGFFTPFNKK